jgi:hypothetical protein
MQQFRAMAQQLTQQARTLRATGNLALMIQAQQMEQQAAQFGQLGGQPAVSATAVASPSTFFRRWAHQSRFVGEAALSSKKSNKSLKLTAASAPRRIAEVFLGGGSLACSFGSKGKLSEVVVAQDFTLDDFRQQLDQIQAMGARELIGTMPGMAAMVPEG